ncbi:MAG: SpoIIE family protein phosphatase [Armatimonadetes bacterium]|nr:SpoIIE family protein phosphatase [Armatimonadota bacterium]
MRILIVDPDPYLAEVWRFTLEARGYRVDIAHRFDIALAMARGRRYRALLVDVGLIGPEVPALLAAIRHEQPEAECVITTEFGLVEGVVQAINEGVYAYLTKPVLPGELISTVERALEKQRLERENRRMVAQLHRANQTMRELIDNIGSAVLLVDAGNQVELANRQALELLGLEEEMLRGRDADSVLRQCLAPRALDPEGVGIHLLSTRRQGVADLELVHPRRCVLRRRTVPLRGHDGSCLGRVEVITDVTADTECLERERGITAALQRCFLPEITPDVEGLDVAVRYQAAWEEARIGGDFYDLWALPGGRTAFAIGDVSGKGPAAAAHTAVIRHALRVYASEEASLATVLARLNRFVYQQMADQDCFATLFYGELSLAELRLRYVSAGHEPTLLWQAQGQPVTELGVGGPAIGAMRDGEYVEGTAAIPPGSALLLYTDGIVEARRGSDFLGLDRLAAVFAQRAAGTSAQALADSVYATTVSFAGGPLHDDAAVLVLRVR